jgi:hypothetical protein
MMKKPVLLNRGIFMVLILFFLFGASAQEKEASFSILGVNKIWDRAPHNAFTDLIRFQDEWYCAFREGGDIRDAKLSVTGNGQLMLSGAVRFLHPEDGNNHQSLTWLSEEGMHWKGPFVCSSGLGTWRWSTTWHDGKGYSIGYSGKDKSGCLYGTRDGMTWEVILDKLFPEIESYPNETSLVFDENHRAYCLLRRDELTAIQWRYKLCRNG